MTKRLFLICASIFFLALVSCSNKNKNSGSISLDVSNFFTQLSKDSENSEIDDNFYSLNLMVFGDFSYDYCFNGKLKEFNGKEINIEHIPLGSYVSILVNISKNNVLYYSGSSTIQKIEAGPNSLNLKMHRCKNQANNSGCSEEALISSPIITVTANNGETTKNGKIVFNSNSEAVFSVSGVNPYPENTLYSWFINGEQVFSELGEAYSSSMLPIDFSQNPDFEFENKITVWVYYEDIMKSANVDFLFTDSR